MKSIVLRIGLTLAAVPGIVSSYSQVHDPLSAFARKMENALALNYRLEMRHQPMMSDSSQESEAFVHIRFDSTDGGRSFFIYSPGRHPVLYNGTFQRIKIDEMSIEEFKDQSETDLLRGMGMQKYLFSFRTPQFEALSSQFLQRDSSYRLDGNTVIVYSADFPPEGDISDSRIELHIDSNRLAPVKYVARYEMMESFIQLTDAHFVEFTVDLPQEENTEEEAPAGIYEIEYVSLNGQTASFSEAKGKMLLLDFWYKACYPCRKAMPHVQEIYEKQGGEDLLVMGVNPIDAHDDPSAAKLLEKLGIDYPQAFVRRQTADFFKVQAYPSLMLFDRRGQLVWSTTGYQPGMEQAVEDALQKWR